MRIRPTRRSRPAAAAAAARTKTRGRNTESTEVAERNTFLCDLGEPPTLGGRVEVGNSLLALLLTAAAGIPSARVYNQNLQIVQTSDRVVIFTEMIHDARIGRMNAGHLPPAIRVWLGDSMPKNAVAAVR